MTSIGTYDDALPSNLSLPTNTNLTEAQRIQIEAFIQGLLSQQESPVSTSAESSAQDDQHEASTRRSKKYARYAEPHPNDLHHDTHQASTLVDQHLQQQLKANPVLNGCVEETIVAVKQALKAQQADEGAGGNGAEYAVKSKFGSTVSHIASLNSPNHRDLDHWIQYIMRESYVSTTMDLLVYGNRLQFYTELKKKIRAELNRAREFEAQYATELGPDGKMAQEYTKLDFPTTPNQQLDGSCPVPDGVPCGTTNDPKEFKAYIKNLEETLNSAGDDQQLAQLDLQQITQNAQRTTSTMSNLSKIMYEIAMGIIRNLRS